MSWCSSRAALRSCHATGEAVWHSLAELSYVDHSTLASRAGGLWVGMVWTIVVQTTPQMLIWARTATSTHVLSIKSHDESLERLVSHPHPLSCLSKQFITTQLGTAAALSLQIVDEAV